jgi:YVTN family beta-propeller protein
MKSMNRNSGLALRIVAVLGLVLPPIAAAQSIMQTPAGERYVELDPNGETVLPNGRLITPVGDMVRVRPHPYGLAMSPDGRWVVAVSSEGPQLTILDATAEGDGRVRFIPEASNEEKGVLDAAFMGLGFSPDSETVYVAGGRDWSVTAFDLASGTKTFRIDCAHETDDGNFKNGYVGDLRVTNDGSTIYALDQSNFRMLVIDVRKQSVITSIQVGRHPFGITLDPDEKRAYVANVGMFEYDYYRDADGKRAKLAFPPVGVPSQEAEDGLVVDGVTVPALGDMNDIRGMSVWTVDIGKRKKPNVVNRTNTGHLVGEQLEDFPAVGGSSPNSIVATESHVYISNGSNDSITVLNRETGEREPDIDLILDESSRNLRGLIPFGMALSPSAETLYVAEAGINAIGVVRLSDRTVLGHIPTAWFPSKIAVSPDGSTLYAACAKGIGSGPNHGPGHKDGDPTGIGSLMRGYINTIDLTEPDWSSLTAQVVNNNVRYAEPTRSPGHPIPSLPGAWESPIKHVIYVTKENRTYDEIFGAVPGGRGDAELCRLGRPIDVSSSDGSRTVKDVVLMPNHLALAKRFAINDNFYCDSDHSIDGHRWLVGTYPNEFMESRIGQSARGSGPGNHAFIGSSGAIYPEDYNEAGSIWEHFERNGIGFFNYGLGFEFKPQEETIEYKYTGIRVSINYPMPQVLLENTSRKFATYNTNIPDQFRMDMFEQEFREKWLSGEEPFPDVITMMLPNDHGAGERPDDGYPFWGSYMSDNDLALGRLVELISNSPFWESTAIFVTEDDAQGYRDTVDAHRSICMVISPYAKRDYVSHTHSSFGSILKSMFLIHGAPPLNQYDAFSTDLAGMFETEPSNLEPYKALPVNKEIFDPQKAFDPFDREFNWEAMADFVPMDDQEFLDSDAFGHSGEAGHAPRAADAASE